MFEIWLSKYNFYIYLVPEETKAQKVNWLERGGSQRVGAGEGWGVSLNPVCLLADPCRTGAQIEVMKQQLYTIGLIKTL